MHYGMGHLEIPAVSYGAGYAGYAKYYYAVGEDLSGGARVQSAGQDVQ